MLLPTASQIRQAAARLQGIAVRTPLVPSPDLSRQLGVDVFLKCENLQATGSFKVRGAYNALASLRLDERERGVVASSAGNHGLGLSFAARMLGVSVKVFMPSSAPRVKRDGIIALGAEVDSSSPDYDAAHAAALRRAEETGRVFINPCAGVSLLAGQGTVALEIVEELPTVATMVVPVGGGGLVGGAGALIRQECEGVRIVGAQSEATAAMARSLEAGRRVDVDVVPTLADGLAGQVDDEGLAIGRQVIDAMAVISEKELAAAIAWLADAHGLKVEGSGAVGVAAIRSGRLAGSGGPVVVVLSGGNIDDDTWESIRQAAGP